MYRKVIALSMILVASAALAEQPAAWPDVFIKMDNYMVAFEAPVVGKGDKPDTYRQKAVYTWSGNRYEIIEITLARDPAFKGAYSAETLKKEKTPPKELEIGKRKAWLWEFSEAEGKFDKITHRMVVVLGDDKAIIIEQKGTGADLTTVAKKFDFDKVTKALDEPPKK